ncbi:MAG: hypothetical protein DRJ52_07045 [Thermoprotei archaeon]|nr:MAG: hypothetical protein DRJ52_07045 [Thermoprotei archaeon]
MKWSLCFYTSLKKILLKRLSVREFIKDCVELGIDKLFVLAKDTESRVYFDTDLCEKAYDGGDLFEEIVRAARDVGIEVHAWFCLYPESVENPSKYLREHPEAVLVNKYGKTNWEEPTWSYIKREYSKLWVCPSHEGYREYLASLMREVLEKYDVNGIHLDYVRYPEALEGRYYCYCPRCLNKYEKEYGYSVYANDVIERRYFVSILCENVSKSVEYFSDVAKVYGASISAYVFTDYVTAIESCYQDWPYFSQYLDFIVPTIYEVAPDYALFLIKKAINAVMHSGCKVMPAIMTSSSTRRSAKGGKRWSSDRSTKYILECINKCREASTAGAALFLYDTTSVDIIDELKETLSPGD